MTKVERAQTLEKQIANLTRELVEIIDPDAPKQPQFLVMMAELVESGKGIQIRRLGAYSTRVGAEMRVSAEIASFRAMGWNVEATWVTDDRVVIGDDECHTTFEIFEC